MDSGKTTYRGVAWHVRHKKWRAKIAGKDARGDRVDVHLGYYKIPETAARVYDVAAVFLQGVNAKLNFDGTPPASVPRVWVKEKLRKAGVVILF